MEVSGTMLKSAAVGILTGGSVLATVIQNKCYPENSNTVKNEFVTSPKTDVVEVSKISNGSIINKKVYKDFNIGMQKAEQPKAFKNLLHYIKK